MADHTFNARRMALALALAASSALPTAALSQSTLAPVTITGKSPVPASVAGWGDVPLDKAPLAATSVDAAQIRDAGARRLSDLTHFDPSVTTAYDAEGYVDYFTIRGFVVDNRFNFRRDGLPINAETSIPLENKARVDILKGTSGIQAGTSAPGGIVDLVVKRPLDAPLRSAFVEWRQRGSVAGSVDLSQRFGAPGDFAKAYVIAHEIGHHVQNQLGIMEKVDAMRGRGGEAQANALSVRVELQADCFAGVWAARSQKEQGWRLDPGDIEQALNAASQIGDDTLQQKSRGTVVPESFTHGTSAQRVSWFKRGVQSGSVDQCNTFQDRS